MDRFCQVQRVGIERVVLCQFAVVLIQATRIDIFKRARYSLVQSDPAWRNDLVVERLSKEGMAEAIHDGRANSGAQPFGYSTRQAGIAHPSQHTIAPLD